MFWNTWFKKSGAQSPETLSNTTTTTTVEVFGRSIALTQDEQELLTQHGGSIDTFQERMQLCVKTMRLLEELVSPFINKQPTTPEQKSELNHAWKTLDDIDQYMQGLLLEFRKKGVADTKLVGAIASLSVVANVNLKKTKPYIKTLI